MLMINGKQKTINKQFVTLHIFILPLVFGQISEQTVNTMISSGLVCSRLTNCHSINTGTVP